MRILYVHSTVQPPPLDVNSDRFFLLSDRVEGEVLHPIWFREPKEVESVFGAGSFPAHRVGRFRYHWVLAGRQRLRDRFSIFWFYVKKGLELHREKPFDCIVVYSHMTTALMAAALKMLTGSRLVIEIVTDPNRVYITEKPRPGLRERFMKLYSDVCLHLTALMSDRAHFLYHGQLDRYPLLRRTPNSVFHEYVPVSAIDKLDDRDKPEKYVLLVGAPWFLKGADVLIQAFLRVAPRFPDVRLKILGHYPDRMLLEKLTGGSDRVEILAPRPHPEAIKIIRAATVVVAPSRCEGLGRVLLEAMSAAVPVIGSDIGGIPMLVRDGENGFLFPVGDDEALSQRLTELLLDEELRGRMGEAGYRRAHAELDENSWVREFARMIEAAVGRNEKENQAEPG